MRLNRMTGILPGSVADLLEGSGGSLGGLAAILGGLLWMGLPVVVTSIELRTINLVYVLPLVLIGTGVLEIERFRDGAGLLTTLGSLLTVMTIGIAGVGVLVESLVPIGTLVEWGIGNGAVFFIGFFGMLVVSPVIGVGLWRSFDGLFLEAVLFVAALPLAAAGLLLLAGTPFAAFNWVPVTVPYGLAWVAMGYRLVVEARAVPGDGPPIPA